MNVDLQYNLCIKERDYRILNGENRKVKEFKMIIL